jgi:hypothetical protein
LQQLAKEFRNQFNFVHHDDEDINNGFSRRLLSASGNPGSPQVDVMLTSKCWGIDELHEGGKNAMAKYSILLGVELSNLFLCCLFLFVILIVTLQGTTPSVHLFTPALSDEHWHDGYSGIIDHTWNSFGSDKVMLLLLSKVDPFASLAETLTDQSVMLC